jgi:hypothetical protein
LPQGTKHARAIEPLAVTVVAEIGHGTAPPVPRRYH